MAVNAGLSIGFATVQLAFVCVCVRACVRVCVRARARARVCVLQVAWLCRTNNTLTHIHIFQVLSMARAFSLYWRARKCWKDDWSQTCFLFLFAYFVFIYLEKSEDSLLKPDWVACDATEKPELRLAWSRPGYSIECFSYPLLWNLPFCFLPSSLVQWPSFSPKLFNHSVRCHGQWI